jgi:hypothetical protein
VTVGGFRPSPPAGSENNALKAGEIELVGLNAQQIAGRDRLQALLAEAAS